MERKQEEGRDALSSPTEGAKQEHTSTRKTLDLHIGNTPSQNVTK